MPLSGNLRQVALADVLLTVEQGRRTGCLVITRGQLRAEIYFANGQWLVIERVPVGPPIAQQFVDLGFLTPEQFEDIARVPFVQAAIIPDVDTVRMLMRAGMLTQDQLRFWALSDAVALVQVIQAWQEGDVSFTDNVPVPAELVPVPLQVGQVLSWSQGETEEPEGLSLDSVINFTELESTDGPPIAITPNEWRVLTMVDGALPLWAIAEALQAPEDAVFNVAQALTERGLVVPVGRVGAGAPPQS